MVMVGGLVSTTTNDKYTDAAKPEIEEENVR